MAPLSSPSRSPEVIRLARPRHGLAGCAAYARAAMGLGVVFLGLLSAPRGAVGQVPSGVTVAVDGPPTVAAREVFTWSVTVRNAAARSRRNVVVVDTLPAQATVVAISGGGVESGGVIRWPPIASLPVGGPPVVLTVTVQAPPGAATLTNTAVVLSAQPNLDGPKVASFTTVVAAGPPPPPPPSGADLSILKTGPPVVASEGTLTYALTVRNGGPDPAVDVVVEDVLPSAGRFVGASGGGTHAGGVIRWPVIPLLAPGAQRTFTVEFQAPTGPSQLTNRATVRSGTSDPVPTNDTSSVRTTVEPPVPPEIDVGVTATGPLSVPAGGLVTYTVEVVNTRSVPARGVSLQFQLPPNAAFVSASGGAILNGALLAWPPIAVLPVGGRLRFTITVRAPGTGTLEGIAIVTTPGDVDPANDTARVETRVQGSAGGSTDLEVRKSGPARVDPGAVAVYRIVARNRGAQSAFDVVVADTLPDPALAQFVSASPAPSAHPTPPAVIEWPALPVLGPGDSVVYEVRLRLPVPGARVADIASVRSSTPDSDPTNDADTAVTETGGASTGSTRLRVTKEAGRSEAQVGDVVQYRIDVEAEGVPGVDVQDLLPPGFLYVPGSTRIGGTIAADPTPAAGGWLDFGTFPTDPVTGTLRLTLTYRAEIGPSAPVGEGVNRVRVRGGPTTEESEARVRVRGAFREEGVIVGSVFLDCGCDPAQLDGEPGIPGVRVYLQDGTAAITDSDGRYSLYGLRPRNWIVRVDRSTLPAGAALVRLSNRHSDDGVSALVDLTRGEMHRADFGVTRSERLAGEIEARRRQPQVTSALPAPAPVLVRGTTFRSLVPATEGPVGVPGPLAPPDPAMPAAAGLDSTAVPGAVQAEVERDLPAPEPLALSGLLEARIDLRSSGVALAGADAFQDRLTRLTWSDDTHERTAGARGSLFAHGALGDGYTVTARLDTEPIPDVRVFRDIEPDAFYPVWGDASLSRFGARSTSRFFGEVRRGASSLTYGDFRTGPGLATGGVALGAYDRVLTGAIQHLETERVQVDAFARRGRSSRVVDEIPARGVSGPYSLSRADGLLHSELVEIVTYDRNQPGRVVAVERLERFQDYTLEPFTGRLLLRRPVPAVDAALNPLVLRVGYEVEGDTDAFWTVGGFAQVRAHDRVELGGGWIRDDDPVGRFDLASVNAAVEVLDATYLIGELARRDGGASGRQGDAGRVELRHRSDRVALDAFFVGTDPDFENPTSVFRAGRREAGLRSVTALGERTRALADWIQTRDRTTGGERSGGLLALEQRLGARWTARVGFRVADETVADPLPEAAGDPDPVRALGVRLGAELAEGAGRVHAEFEQDVVDAERRRLELGADWRVRSGVRLYARHELLSSLTGPYGLAAGQERNTTVLGIAGDGPAGSALFSEYRARDAFAGREAQAAIGLRNRWSLAPGVRLNTSFERLAPLSGSSSGDALAITGALELTTDSLWKATARAEYYDAEGGDNLLGSLGYARRLNERLSLLGSSVFSVGIGGARSFERTRVGLAWRDVGRNRWNALGRYEHHYERSPDLDGLEERSLAHVFAAHVNVLPRPDLLLRADWSSTWNRAETALLDVSETAHLLGARGTLDVTRRLDVGLIGRALLASLSDRVRYGLGAELGLRIRGDLRVAAGYNVFGFRDRDPVADERTARGFYVQLGFRFDEGLFGLGPEPVIPVVDPACACADEPDPAALSVHVLPQGVSETLDTVWVVTRNEGTAPAEAVVLEVRVDSLEVLSTSRSLGGAAGGLGWTMPRLPGGAERVDTLVVRASCGQQSPGHVRAVVTTRTPEDRSDNEDGATLDLRADAAGCGSIPPDTTPRTEDTLPTPPDTASPPVLDDDPGSDGGPDLPPVDPPGPGLDPRNRPRPGGDTDGDPLPDLRIQARPVSTDRTTDRAIWFEVTTWNAGRAPASDVALTGSVPGTVRTATGLLPRFVTASLDPSGASARPGVELDGAVRWPLHATLAPGDSLRDWVAVTVPCADGVRGRVDFELPFRVAARDRGRALPEGQASATWWIDADCPTPPPATDTTDLAVDLTAADRTVVRPGERVALLVRSDNLGEVPALRMVTSARRPGGAAFERGSARPPRLASTQGGQVEWTPPWDRFEPRETSTDSVFLIAPDSTFWVHARVASASPERRYDNNRDSVAIVVSRDPIPDLEISIRALVLDQCPSRLLLVTTNRGSGSADGLAWTVSLPVEARLLDASGRVRRRPAEWSSPTPLAPGASRTDTLRIRFGADGGGPLHARVRSSTADADSTNNQAMVMVMLQDTLSVACCGTSTCALCGVPPWLWWLLFLLALLLTAWGIYRKRRYGRVFARCFRRFTFLRGSEIEGHLRDLRDPRNRGLDEIRRFHDRLGPQPCMDWRITVEMLHAYRDHQAWSEIYLLIARMPPALARQPIVRRLHAFALHRDGQSGRAEAELRDLLRTQGPRASTLGQLGRIHKDAWDEARSTHPADPAARGLLDEAIATYRRGHDADPANPYPGLNALTLSGFLDGAPAWRDRLHEQVRDAARRKAAECGTWTDAVRTAFAYWVHATRAELAVLDRNPDEARSAMDAALDTHHVVWQVETTTRNFRLIADAWVAREGAAPDWLVALIADLEGRMQAERA